MKYTPLLVRAGVKVPDNLKRVSLEDLAMRSAAWERDYSWMTRKSEHMYVIEANPNPFLSDTLMDKARRDELRRAEIVLTTLSYSGLDIFSRIERHFDVVVIDEAAQAVEPSTLIPLRHNCRQLFLVGDPVQLPATILSTRAVENTYDMSLFERLMVNDYKVNLLQTQYRMHPSLRAFPSKTFYHNIVKDGENVKYSTLRKWHERNFFGPLAFYDVSDTKDQLIGTSFMNQRQASCVVELVQFLLQEYPEIIPSHQSSNTTTIMDDNDNINNATPTTTTTTTANNNNNNNKQRNQSSMVNEETLIGIISPYKAQIEEIKELLIESLGEDTASKINVNTVDGFQGRERDIIIYRFGIRKCVEADCQYHHL